MGIRITPSILNADFSHLDEEIARIAAVSDLLHLDVMDNVFVPNFTFDFDQAAAIIASSPIPVDSHLMIADVDLLAPAYAHAGSASVTIHAEASSSISSTLRAIKAEGARAGLALKPGSSILDYADHIDDVDMFLIMTVEPGFGGQKFMSGMMDKVSRLELSLETDPFGCKLMVVYLWRLLKSLVRQEPILSLLVALSLTHQIQRR
jgi:ribulose-phosphate 3-epimerase